MTKDASIKVANSMKGVASSRREYNGAPAAGTHAPNGHSEGVAAYWGIDEL